MKRKFNFMRIFPSIRSAILSTYFLIAMVALSVFAMVALYYTEDTVMENSRDYSNQLVTQINSDIDSYMDYLHNISALIAYNGDVHDYLFGENITELERQECYQRIRDQFTTIMETRDDIVNIGLLGQGERYILNKGYVPLNDHAEVQELDWVRKAYDRHGVTTISSSHVQNIVKGKYEWVITISKALTNKHTQELEGVFFVDLNYSSISELCDAVSFGNKGYVYIMDEEGHLIYHPQQQLLYSGLKEEKIKEVLECKGSSFVTEDGRLYTLSRSTETGWTVVGVAYTEELLKNSDEATRIYLVSAAVILLAALAVAYIMSHEITKPIKRLGDSMREVEKGNFDNALLEVSGENEIDRLSASFNIMTTEIKQLMEQNVEEQRQKRKSELKALQAQINPHFLYNTLDSIIWMAEWGKNKDVVLMTSSLAKLLRQSISNQNEFVRVEEEVAYTKSYLIIQKMRYKDKLEYDIQVDDEVLDVKMPKLVLQPIVENAIYHGIKYKDGKGRVQILGGMENDSIVLKIQDDGIGMTEEQLARIFEKRETDTRRNGVGVLNVHERIQLYYGKEFGLKFSSCLGEGTLAEIRIPMEKGEKDA